MEAKYAWIQDHTQKVAEEPRGHGVFRRSTTRDSIEVRDQLRSKAQYWKSERCCLIANTNYKKLQPRDDSHV